jgi:hypothetical protein
MGDHRGERLRDRQLDMDHFAGKARDRRKLLEAERRDIDLDESRKKEIDAEIFNLQIEEASLGVSSKFYGELLKLHQSNDNEKLKRLLQENSNQKSYTNKSLDDYETKLPSKENISIHSAKDNKIHSEQTHALIDKYLVTYGTSDPDKPDKPYTPEEKEETIKTGFRGLQVAAFAVGVSSLILAIMGRMSPPPHKDNALVLGSDELLSTEGGGHSGTPDENLRLLDAAHGGVSSTNAGVGAGDGTPSEPSAEELEKLMQELVVNKAVIASGNIPQNTLWQNLASVADSLDIEAQNTALMFIQEAAVDLEGGRDFFWLDISQAIERYQALRAAHKRSSKLSDVYREALKIEYDGEKVPPFHVALLIQFALGLIKHDLVFANTEATTGG